MPGSSDLDLISEQQREPPFTTTLVVPQLGKSWGEGGPHTPVYTSHAPRCGSHVSELGPSVPDGS